MLFFSILSHSKISFWSLNEEKNMKLNERTAKMAKIQITRSSMTHEFVGFTLFHFSFRYSSLLLFAGFTFSSELLSLLLPYIFFASFAPPEGFTFHNEKWCSLSRWTETAARKQMHRKTLSRNLLVIFYCYCDVKAFSFFQIKFAY